MFRAACQVATPGAKYAVSDCILFLTYVTCGRGSVRQCNTLCTSGFVDDVAFYMMELMGQNQVRHCYVSSNSTNGDTSSGVIVAIAGLLMF